MVPLLRPSAIHLIGTLKSHPVGTWSSRPTKERNTHAERSWPLGNLQPPSGLFFHLATTTTTGRWQSRNSRTSPAAAAGTKCRNWELTTNFAAGYSWKQMKIPLDSTLHCTSFSSPCEVHFRVTLEPYLKLSKLLKVEMGQVEATKF